MSQVIYFLFASVHIFLFGPHQFCLIIIVYKQKFGAVGTCSYSFSVSRIECRERKREYGLAKSLRRVPDPLLFYPQREAGDV